MTTRKWVSFPELPYQGKLVQTRLTEAAIVGQDNPSAYRYDAKCEDPLKVLYNQNNVAAALDLIAMVPNAKVLLLDGNHLWTTRALVKAGVLLENIWICSCEVEFQGFPPGHTYTGEMSKFLQLLCRYSVKFDMVIFDFCGTYANDQRKSIEYFFSNRMLSPVGVFSITICKRINTEKKRKTIITAHASTSADDIKDYAYICGYANGANFHFENTIVESFWFKMVLPCKVLVKHSVYAKQNSNKWRHAPFVGMVPALEETPTRHWFDAMLLGVMHQIDMKISGTE